MKEEFKTFWKYRFLLSNLIGRDIKVKYRRSKLGILWSVLNPLLMMVVMAAVFSRFFKSDIPNYPVYLLCGQRVDRDDRSERHGQRAVFFFFD